MRVVDALRIVEDLRLREEVPVLKWAVKTLFADGEEKLKNLKDNS